MTGNNIVVARMDRWLSERAGDMRVFSPKDRQFEVVLGREATL